MKRGHKGRRARRSIFDPYREQITEWCSLGITVPRMIEMIGEGYSEQALYTFIRNNHLREPWIDVYSARNQCSECEFCKDIIGIHDKVQKICLKSMRAIAPSVVHSPVWCEKKKVKVGEE